MSGIFLLAAALTFENPVIRTNRLVCLSSKVPTGPFEFRSVILDNRDFGIRDLAIDSEVVVDGGRVWLFTGSVAGGVHRFELTADGLALKTRTPVPGSVKKKETAPDLRLLLR